jgi:hypothetical protein
MNINLNISEAEFLAGYIFNQIGQRRIEIQDLLIQKQDVTSFICCIQKHKDELQEMYNRYTLLKNMTSDKWVADILPSLPDLIGKEK